MLREILIYIDYISYPRNLQVAKMFKGMGLIERYGADIKRVQKLFLDHGLPAPDFKVVQGGFFVMVFAGHRKAIFWTQMSE